MMVVALVLARGISGITDASINSTDTNVQPVLDYRFLEDPSDKERLREAVRECIKIFEDPGFKAVISGRIAPSIEEVGSDDSLDGWIADNLSIAGHTCGTSKMGPESDSDAVVDQ